MSRKIGACFAIGILGGIIFSPFFDHTQAFAQGEISDKIKKLCEAKYDTFKKLGTENFSKTYSHLTYLPDCLMLFKDPSWTFNGKEKIDRQYEKIYQIKNQVNPQINNFENQKVEISKISSNKIGYQTYALKVRICSDDKIVTEPKFFVVTDKEYFLAKSSRDLTENSCNFIMVFANAVNPEKTSIHTFDGNYIPSKYLKIKQVF